MDTNSSKRGPDLSSVRSASRAAEGGQGWEGQV